METRKITIISTRDNNKKVIYSNATTLGELKKDLELADIDYTDMTFYEGLTKTELLLNSSILPHDIQRLNPVTKELETTNELAFMLTYTNKKIKSGMGDLSRRELYTAIRANGLSDKCLKKYNKPYNKCKTEELIALIDNNKIKSATEIKPSSICVDTQARLAIKNLTNFLYGTDIIKQRDIVDTLLAPILELNFNPVEDNSPYSDNELSDMFKDMLY